MNSKIIILGLLFFVTGTLFAQEKNNSVPPITFKGKITFERKNNVHKQMEDMMKGNPGSAAMFDNMKKNIPKYKTDIFELFFNESQSVYKPAPNGISESKMMMGAMPAERNVVFNDYTTHTFTAEKKIFEKTYLIQDSFRNAQWKITEEFRKIAGFNCRRAETIINDSLYVIAFYTDGILAPGGPESFNGLPGMILGIVMPRLNLTYFATKVDNYLPLEKDIAPPTKGDKKSTNQVVKAIEESTKQWGPFAQRILWYIVI
jgi:GLPGLI family protein